MEGDRNLDDPSIEVYGEGVIQVIHSVDDDFGGFTEGLVGEQFAREGIDDLQLLAVEAKGVNGGYTFHGRRDGKIVVRSVSQCG